MQRDAASYKQMGNGVNVGAAYYVFRKYVLAHRDEISLVAPQVVESVLSSSADPDERLDRPT